MNIKIEINIDNAAFSPEPEEELARILRVMAAKLDTMRIGTFCLRDVNGNAVGTFEVIAE